MAIRSMDCKSNKVLISGGRETGGLSSFAEALKTGFEELGIETEVLSQSALVRRWRELRDGNVLKILSTGSIFLAPVARNSIAVVHGFPSVNAQGKVKSVLIILSYLVGRRYSRLTSVSHTTSIMLRNLLKIRVDAVVHNPLRREFSQRAEQRTDRRLLTFAGRLHMVKNLDRFIGPLRKLLGDYPCLSVAIAGTGPEEARLRSLVPCDCRFRFLGDLDVYRLRELLQRSLVVFSGNENEPFGISYLEALSQGCRVVMPASGGGLEIAPDLIGKGVFLVPLPLGDDTILKTLRQAVAAEGTVPFDPQPFSPAAVATRYLNLACEQP